jgi:hypothetical protein
MLFHMAGTEKGISEHVWLKRKNVCGHVEASNMNGGNVRQEQAQERKRHPRLPS